MKARYAAYTNPNPDVPSSASHPTSAMEPSSSATKPSPSGAMPTKAWKSPSLSAASQKPPSPTKNRNGPHPSALTASTQPISLEVKTSHGSNATVKDILIGDVWFLTGSTLLTTQRA